MSFQIERADQGSNVINTSKNIHTLADHYDISELPG